MRGIGRAALVVTILVAGVLVLVQAQPASGMLRGIASAAGMVVNVAGEVVDRVSAKFNSRDGSHDEGSFISSARSQGGDEFRWTGTINDGDALEIKGVNGAVIAEVSSGREVEVVAVKRSRKSVLNSVRIEVVEHRGGVTLCAVYPSGSRSENYCGPGDDGRNNVRNNDVSVTFYVKVPAGIDFHANTVNGDVQIIDLQSDIEASTVNGSVEITTTGFAHASTVNGSIRGAMGVLDPQGMNFSTVNGSINLDLPDDLDADVDAAWVNGKLETEISLEMLGKISKHSAQGRFGEGGPNIELRTVNGSIRIR